MALRGGCSHLLRSLLGAQLPAAVGSGGAAAPLAAGGARIVRWATTEAGAVVTHQQQQGQEDKQQQQEQQQQQPLSEAEAEWLEVVDQNTGQTYYWNESTGETTELGEPRPKARFRDSSFRGAHDSRFQEGWREPPDTDRTYTYSLMGIIVGITAGWATQFFH